MAEELVIRWPSLGVEVVANVLPNANEALFQAIADALPLEGLASHSVTSGLDITMWTPVYATVQTTNMERIDEMPVGRVFASKSGGKILIKYGPQTEWVALPPIAQVREADLPKLLQVGRRIYDAIFFTKELLPMRVELQRGVS